MQLSKESHQIAMLLLLSLAVTAVSFFKNPVIGKDAVRYLHCAQALSLGNWQEAITHEKMPFVPAMIAGFHCLIPNWILAGQSLSIIAMTLAIIPFYWLACQLFGRDKAFISALFFAVAPSLRATAIDIVRDPVFILFFSLFLYHLFLALHQRNARYYFYTILWSGLSLLCRMEGLLLVLGLTIHITIRGFRSHSRRVRSVMCIFWGVVVIAFGLILYCHQTGRYQINRLDEVLSIVRHPVQYYQSFHIHALHEKLKEMEQQKEFAGRSGLLETARTSFIEIYLLSLIKTWIHTAFPVMFILAFLGLWAERHEPNTSSRRCLLYWLAPFLLVPYVFVLLRYDFLSDRYLLPATWIIYLWVGAGFYHLTERLQARFSWKAVSTKIILVCLLLIPVGRIFYERTGRETNIIQSGQWLAQHASRQESMVTNEMRVPFYAQIPFFHQTSEWILPDASLALLRQKAKKLQAHWIVYRYEKPEQVEAGYVQLFDGKRPIAIYKEK